MRNYIGAEILCDGMPWSACAFVGLHIYVCEFWNEVALHLFVLFCFWDREKILEISACLQCLMNEVACHLDGTIDHA